MPACLPLLLLFSSSFFLLLSSLEIRWHLRLRKKWMISEELSIRILRILFSCYLLVGERTKKSDRNIFFCLAYWKYNLPLPPHLRVITRSEFSSFAADVWWSLLFNFLLKLFPEWSTGWIGSGKEEEGTEDSLCSSWITLSSLLYELETVRLWTPKDCLTSLPSFPSVSGLFASCPFSFHVGCHSVIPPVNGTFVGGSWVEQNNLSSVGCCCYSGRGRLLARYRTRRDGTRRDSGTQSEKVNEWLR